MSATKCFPPNTTLIKPLLALLVHITLASAQQTISDRLAKALTFFLNHRTERQANGSPRVGFPRFKTPNRWHSFQLRQYGAGGDVRLDERHLVVPKKLGTRIKIKLHRPIEGTPKTVYVVKRADTHWYALVVCDMSSIAGELHRTEDLRPAIGLDVGLKSFLTDSSGEQVENPRFFRTSQRTLRRKQRTLSRRQKGSRRGKAARSVAQTHLKIERQRRDFHFKVAHRYVVLYALFVVEQLNIQGMVKNRRVSKSIMDAGWASFLNILTYKAERAGSEVRSVPAAYTSQQCSRCGERTPKSLSVRTHVCQHCSFVADRDHNAALNILRAGARPSSDDGHQSVG